MTLRVRTTDRFQHPIPQCGPDTSHAPQFTWVATCKCPCRLLPRTCFALRIRGTPVGCNISSMLLNITSNNSTRRLGSNLFRVAPINPNSLHACRAACPAMHQAPLMHPTANLASFLQSRLSRWSSSRPVSSRFWRTRRASTTEAFNPALASVSTRTMRRELFAWLESAMHKEPQSRRHQTRVCQPHASHGQHPAASAAKPSHPTSSMASTTACPAAAAPTRPVHMHGPATRVVCFSQERHVPGGGTHPAPQPPSQSRPSSTKTLRVPSKVTTHVVPAVPRARRSDTRSVSR